MLQIVFSYDTLVESNQLFDELDNKNDDKNNNNNNNSSDDDDDDSEEDVHDHNLRNGSNIKTKKKNKISGSSNGLNVTNQDSISGKSNGEDTINEISNEKSIFLNGFYGSATEILGLNEEIYNVAKSYKIQKNINQMEENDQKRRGAGRDWKRRVGPNQGYMILHYIYY